MAVTPHVTQHSIYLINTKAISLTSDTFMAYLSATPISSWGATQEAYQFVSDFLTPYPEVSTSGYARVTLAGTAVTPSTGAGLVTKWTCTSPISWGSSITLSAASMFVYDHTIGGTDATSPVISAVDFGATISSTSGNWTYTIDPTNGLASWTVS
jgi:hypothetical protein